MTKDNRGAEAINREMLEALAKAKSALEETYALHKRARDTIPDDDEGLASMIFAKHINWADGPIIDAIAAITKATQHEQD